MNFLVDLFDGEHNFDSVTSIARRKHITIGSQFRKSLDLLISQLSKCEPFFIRCIKPNEMKKPLVFDRDLVCRQLRYSGMMETIRIRKAGYPIRHDYKSFVHRYRVLVNGIGPADMVDCYTAAKKICETVLGAKADFQLGRTKVFLKDAQDLFLQQERERMLNERIITIQKTVRGWIQRKRFAKMRIAAVMIQKHWRGHVQRKRYQQERERMLNERIITIQKTVRGWIQRKRFAKMRIAAVMIQKHWRGHVQRKRYQQVDDFISYITKIIK
uniref:Myosin motor domain-containing protein n=1 Tax=Ascaris lumbricoides TaxID=6252 RepID=A0A0M3IW31_ASCLU